MKNAKVNKTSAAGFQHTKLAYKIREASGLLSVSSKSVRRLIKRGLIRPMMGIRHITISASELDRYVREMQADIFEDDAA